MAQIRDSLLENQFHSIKDSSAAALKDSLKVPIDSVFAKDKADLLDSSKVFFSDSTHIGQDSLSLEKEKKSKIHQIAFSNQSTFISSQDILKNDYRYTGDYFKIFPLSFERSYGFIGQPNDIYLYAEGSSTSSYFLDGEPVSNTLYSSLDFNHIQSEGIDSIEIVPLPRGFVYGFGNNSVAVNFLSKNIYSLEPYSRVKYYEGPFGEAFIDGTFNMFLLRDLIAYVDISNRKVDDSFKNSNFAIWQVKTKLAYNLLNNIKLVGNYYFVKSETGINGGVNIDKALEITPNLNSLLFNETLAPVYFDNNSLKSKQHNFGLRVLAEPVENAYTNVNFYYKFHQNEYNSIDTLLSSKSTFDNKLFGLLLDQRLSFHPFNLALQSGYQSLKYNPEYTSSDSLDVIRYYLNNPPIEHQAFYISPLLSVTLLDSMIIPSLYYKYANSLYKNTLSGLETKQKFIGFGADIAIYFKNNLNLYFGYSQFENEYFMGEKINALEMKLNYKNSDGNVTLNLFNKKSPATSIYGIGLNASYLIWKILLEGRISQYFVGKGSTLEFINIPETKFNAGVYFKDSLFNSNLDLKAGFSANYTGKQKLVSLPIIYSRAITTEIESWLTVDFTVTAEIQKKAIVYFTWENLFDWMYYITPYYPMLERNIRFGIAWEILN